MAFLNARSVRERVSLHRLRLSILVLASGMSLWALSCGGRQRLEPYDAAPGSGGEASGTGGEVGIGGNDFGGAGGQRPLESPVEFSFDPTGKEVECAFEIGSSTAPDMPTVGRVAFDVDGLNGPITGAVIEFGLTTEYGQKAWVDLRAEEFEALILGMKSERSYHFRIGVSSNDQFCYSDDHSIRSGVLRSGILELDETRVEPGVAPGFIVAAQGRRVIIFDRDGDIVWGYSTERLGNFSPSCGAGGAVTSLFSAKLSFDGRYMLARDLGPFDCGDGGTFFRIAMDGSEAESIELPGGDHHDFTVTPFGIAYIAKAERGGYDKIYVAQSDGAGAHELFDLGPAVEAYPKVGGPGMEKSHFNVIHYWRDRDIYTLSNRESDAIVMVSGDGELVGGIGRAVDVDFETYVAEGAEEGGAGEHLWRVQHGHDLYAPDKLLVFSNGQFVGGQAHALHYTFIEGNIARLDWSYTRMGNSATQGDIQMLPNGHVLVTASNSGLMQEIDETQNILASYRAPEGNFGYVMHRTSLYGAPPDGR